MLILLLTAIFLIFSAILILIFNKKTDEKIIEIPAECCGVHEVCERNRLLTTTNKIVYFDDEELDILMHKNPENFTKKELEMLQEVIFSLKKSDILGWLHSLELRNIELPIFLKEQAMFIFTES
ncbi:MAG: phospholipase [Prevotellaceae bacterium]|jgi:hypothetical protein|nr:phospholipase [Prevotellaceae bacterium]